MPLSKVFWVLSFLTLIFIALQTMGYDVMVIIVLLLTMDVISVELSRQLDRHHLKKDVKESMTSRLDSIEKLCGNIAYHLEGHIPAAEQITFVIDKKMADHKDSFKDDLDKIAKKMCEIENNMTRLKRLMAGAVASLDDRIKAVEDDEVEIYPSI